MSKFKVGDKVRISLSAPIQQGTVGTIDSIDQDGNCVIGSFWFTEDELELVTTYKTKTSRSADLGTLQEEVNQMYESCKKSQESFKDDKIVKCNHSNKKVVKMVYSAYLYCPDCKEDLGDVE